MMENTAALASYLDLSLFLLIISIGLLPPGVRHLYIASTALAEVERKKRR